MKRFVLAVALLSALAGMQTPAGAFSDVPPDHWAADAVAQCVAQGWFQGRSASYFGVDEPISRSAFAAVLCRFFAWQPSAAYYPIFSDVPRSAWYEPSLRACYEQGAIPRQTDTFRPNAPLSREELAAILIRSLGLGAVAGLAGEAGVPFQDLRSSRGHIAMACALGLLNGTAPDLFSPDRPATRGQTAAVLLRLWQKRTLPIDEAAVLIEPRDAWPQLPEGAVAVVMAGVLSGGESARLSVSSDAAALTASVRQAQAAGRSVLLGVTGSSEVLRAGVTAAPTLAAAVAEGGYDGLYLDLRQGASHLPELTVLAQALRSALPQGRLYLAIAGPQRTDAPGDYAAVASAVDRLVVRLEAQTDFSAAVPVSAMETPERLYDALRQLSQQVPPRKLSLQLTVRAAAVRDRRTSSLAGSEVERLRSAGAAIHYSDRYACAYFRHKDTTVWYLDKRGLSERHLLLGCFGVTAVCLSSVQGTVSLTDLLPGTA